MSKSITVLISTYNDRLAGVSRVFVKNNSTIKYKVLHQITDNNDYSLMAEELKKSNPNIEYIPLDSKGVTKSRNTGLCVIDTDYGLFADDDITYPDNLEDIIINAFEQSNEASVLTFQSADPDTGQPRKQYPAQAKIHNRISILSVGTIEMAFDVNRVKESGVLFPEYMGAGTQFPAADEPVFLARLMKRGHTIGYVPQVIAYHSDDSSGKSIQSEQELLSRGLAFREIFGTIAAPLILALFYLKNRHRMSGAEHHPLITMLKGYKLIIERQDGSR